MAEMNLGFSPTPVQSPQTTGTADPGRMKPLGQDRDRDQDRDTGKVGSTTEKELENVVSVSEDGDTVQASPAGVEKLSDDTSVRVVGERNRVENTPPEDDFQTDDAAEAAAARQKEAAERRAEVIKEGQEAAEERAEALKEAMEAQAEKDQPAISAEDQRVSANSADQREGVRVDVGDNAPDRQVTSYAGISDQQLEQMYRDGTISKYDYDNEVASREQRAEQNRENIQEFDQNTAGVLGTANQTMQNFNAIEDAYNREQTVTEAREATERLDAMNTVQKVLDGTA